MMFTFYQRISIRGFVWSDIISHEHDLSHLQTSFFRAEANSQQSFQVACIIFLTISVLSRLSDYPMDFVNSAMYII